MQFVLVCVCWRVRLHYAPDYDDDNDGWQTERERSRRAGGIEPKPTNRMHPNDCTLHCTAHIRYCTHIRSHLHYVDVMMTMTTTRPMMMEGGCNC